MKIYHWIVDIILLIGIIVLGIAVVPQAHDCENGTCNCNQEIIAELESRISDLENELYGEDSEKAGMGESDNNIAEDNNDNTDKKENKSQDTKKNEPSQEDKKEESKDDTKKEDESSDVKKENESSEDKPTQDTPKEDKQNDSENDSHKGNSDDYVIEWDTGLPWHGGIKQGTIDGAVQIIGDVLELIDPQK